MEDLVVGEKYLVRLTQVYVGHIKEFIVKYETELYHRKNEFEFFDKSADPLYLKLMSKESGNALWKINVYKMAPDAVEMWKRRTLDLILKDKVGEYLECEYLNKPKPASVYTYYGTYCTYYGVWGR
jgi:hypothetical protein